MVLVVAVAAGCGPRSPEDARQPPDGAVVPCECDQRLEVGRAGEITENPIGVCLQVDGYDLGRVSDEVSFRDNEVDLQATTLPVPDGAPP